MSWNYRIIFHENDIENYYGLHEVYYNEDGSLAAYTANPINFISVDEEGPEGIIANLEMALFDANSKPVLTEEDFE